ncbi:Na+/H+ antiporter subunit E [Variovorax sp. PAMC28562]|uniref:Na+/H+ antiporter subunit E n=1 Tax=Variovorax sp. PAMC28562 TaxID=2762323 RepID=UPI00164D1188|nr:Na+/H+ antiporter subunit E [Variovorax sp. PAMC28562]QNK72001.1 Na+/H+ antiporter subunit E [Variovorax sp. PAMC28562]
MKRWLPSPPLSLALFIVWLLLNQSMDSSTLLLAAILSIAVPLLTRSLRPATVRMRRPGIALMLVGRVMDDLSVSAWTVARMLLTRRTADIHSAFVKVPLQMRDPNGLAVLAMILCLTPGTAWAELSFDSSVLLIHVFNVDDEAAFVAQVQQRYERPLMEIFES